MMMVDAVKIEQLVTRIDHLVERLMDAQKSMEPQTVRMHGVDIENIIKFGVYDPDDPTAMPRRALLAIGETLGIIGGREIMDQVFAAYKAKYGTVKAAKLHARWDTAAGIW